MIPIRIARASLGSSQVRLYSDFLNKLPRVGGGGISRFAKKTTIEPKTKNAGIDSSKKELNENKPVRNDSKNSSNNFKQSNPRNNEIGKGNNSTNRLNKNDPNGNRFRDKFNSRDNDNSSNSSPNSSTSTNSREGTNLSREGTTNRFKTDASNLTDPKREPFKRPLVKKPNFPSNKFSNKKNFKAKSVPKIKIKIPAFITVSNLASIMNIPIRSMLAKLEILGYEGLRYDFILEKEDACLIADEYNFDVEILQESINLLDLSPAPIKEELLKERPPVVTIMGHVDHGKTTILDYLRKSSVVDEEFGGITQHIGAFSVLTPISKKRITFLDTPGHAAFLKMRERGANITDIVILVVAADDSVMPQTIEAIKHAKKSRVPIIVAINKCDKEGIKIDQVLSDLALHEIDIEDYGGDTQTIQVSGKTGLNMDKLEEAIITLSELNEFKAEESEIPVEGWIIESQMVKGMGPIATTLIRRGSLKIGQFIIAGKSLCKVKGMKDENGKSLKIAGPSTPVQVWGWKDLPEAGDQILQAENEKIAKEVINNRDIKEKEIKASEDIGKINKKRQEFIEEAERLEKINKLKLLGLDTTEFDNVDDEGNCLNINYMIKSDVFGSAEAIKESINLMGNEEVKARVISYEAGPPTEGDIDLAKTIGAEIFCFNIKIPKSIINKAEKEGVILKEHNIIYRLIEDVTDKLQSHLKPRIETKILGEVEIKDIFQVSLKNKTKVKVAGCKVLMGVIKKNSQIRVKRGETIVFDGALLSLKRVKDDINEARKGFECGVMFDQWEKFQPGDVIEVYELIEHQRFL